MTADRPDAALEFRRIATSNAALHRLMLALLARHVAQAENPLHELETLRNLAQGPLRDELPDVVDRLERVFAQVHAAVIDHGAEGA